MFITPLGTRLFVRFARKPIWMPTAPSKLFRINEYKFYDKDEIEQIRKLDIVYRAQFTSIARMMEQEFYIPATQAGGMPIEFVENEKLLDEQIYAANDKKNAEIAKEKEQYFKLRIEELENKIMERKIDEEEELLEIAQSIDQFVRQNKDDPEAFVTPENFDTMIEKVMQDQNTYEFCIDRSGRRYGPAIKEEKIVKN